ncbi:hypothetical protein [Arenimonas caeni]|jgi:hypothetical protein|uniref:Late embryogenesis abundant protein LEA-2 subgroup domain-containing protein n=1 Tax=Arenimonas caeni TaxID=2058085 RepID=A0A2P6M7M2_9GAMM|nr:hypothetical protein [Arenimonas caeni]MDY0023141.1 hypothetical protein [Arenimonas caeni]PRH81983.1 hypothetical protein C6N40_09260 [Arenimonas caeni]
MRRLHLVLFLALATLLAACAGGPPKRVYPPQASVQELQVQADGSWLVKLRIRNFSTVPMHFSRLEGTLSIDGQEAGRFDFNPGLAVGPGSAEIIEQRMAPPAAARDAVAAALANRQPLRYQLGGRLASSDPGTNDKFDYSSRLDPVPGLEGVLR